MTTVPEVPGPNLLPQSTSERAVTALCERQYRLFVDVAEKNASTRLGQMLVQLTPLANRRNGNIVPAAVTDACPDTHTHTQRERGGPIYRHVPRAPEQTSHALRTRQNLS